MVWQHHSSRTHNEATLAISLIDGLIHLSNVKIRLCSFQQHHPTDNGTLVNSIDNQNLGTYIFIQIAVNKQVLL
jgi:hypothetical protein